MISLKIITNLFMWYLSRRYETLSVDIYNLQRVSNKEEEGTKDHREKNFKDGTAPIPFPENVIFSHQSS